MKYLMQIFSLAVVATCLKSSTLAEEGKVMEIMNFKVKTDTMKNIFVDEVGRMRIFHGFNSIRKSFPWYKEELLNDTKLGNIAY